LGWLRRQGRGWRSTGSSRDRGLVTGKGLFWSSFPTFVLWPVFEYLDNNYGAILGDLGDKRKAVYRRPQSTFPPFYRKGLIGIWYYNLRSLLKATSLGHPEDIEARPQYKER
jgi:hypothetical protein